MGTTRISENPKNGVVDSHCKVHRIGSEFLAQHPSEKHFDQLIESIGVDPRQTKAFQFKQKILEQIQNDANQDDLMIIKSWIFTKTEASIYALATFL